VYGEATPAYLMDFGHNIAPSIQYRRLRTSPDIQRPIGLGLTVDIIGFLDQNGK